MSGSWQNIPREMREVPRWVCWRLVHREPKPTKVPIDARTGREASSTDPQTWTTFDQAKDACGRLQCDGVGFVLGDGWAGVDLDDGADDGLLACRNPDSGQLAPWARHIVERLNSYAEASPSGRGVHIITRAKLPPGRRRTGKGHPYKVEMYDSGRYFTVTGYRIEGTPTTVEERTAELAAWHAEVFAQAASNGRPPGPAAHVDLDDSALIEKATAAKNGARFAALWAGNWQAEAYPSQSEADAALCSLLAFWTGKDAGRIDALFRQSGLFRAKWEREDYRTQTIQNAIANCQETYQPRHSEQAAGVDLARPCIRVNGRFLRDIAADALEALQKANSPPWLFLRGGTLVRVGLDGSREADTLSATALKGVLDRIADFVEVRIDDESGKEKSPVPKRPPADLAPDLLALRDPPFPALRSISAVPVFSPGGRLLARDGYDDDSGILLRLQGLDGVRADMSVDGALHWLLVDLLGDFPFADNAGKAHTLALLLERFVRAMLAGPTPLYLIDAPAQGTGKGLLAEAVALVVMGIPAPVMALSTDDDETEKRITAILLAGAPLVLLDNVTVLRSTSLAAVLTAETWRGRRLGKSEIVHVPNDASWIATGNNVELSHELARRAIPIRLDAGMERPEERTGFRHGDLPGWVRRHRVELVSACLSLVRLWIDAGMPRGRATLGRYESWAQTLGGILEVAGVPGFLEGRDRLYAEADRETRDWEAFAGAWWEAFGEAPVTAGTLFVVAKERGLIIDVWGGRSHTAAMQRLGHALARRRDRVFGGWVIRSAGRDAETRNAAYRLERQGQDKTLETPDTTMEGGKTSMQTTSPGLQGPGLLNGWDSKTPAKHPQNTQGEDAVRERVSETKKGLSGVLGVLDRPQQAAGADDTAPSPCYCCGGRRFWRRGNQWVCHKCHPPPVPEMVEEWSV